MFIIKSLTMLKDDKETKWVSLSNIWEKKFKVCLKIILEEESISWCNRN
jgi:hypothetical protein